ncbi:MAG: hypothetical protein H0W99_10390, partial [Acidobacteria bacterium]|nr:hypothetical protein [Acidobacteriota bacterium]
MKRAKSTSSLLILVLLALMMAASARQPQADIERRIDALLSRMMLEEKLGQLQQLDG